MPTITVKEVSGPHQSKNLKHQRLVLWRQVSLGLGIILCLLSGIGDGFAARAQTIKAQITVTSLAPARVEIRAELASAINSLSFRNAYAGILGLGERIEKLEATDANGASIPIKKLVAGEFRSREKFSRFSYEVNLTEPARPAQRSHVSWLNAEHGLLMLADLLPQSADLSTASIDVNVPGGWTAASNAEKKKTQFWTDDVENAVFLVGSAVDEKEKRVSSTDFSLARSGKWPFADNDAIKLAEQILQEHSNTNGIQLKKRAVVMLLPYPGDTGPETWSAETRGNVVVLLLGRNASRKRVLTKLGIVLSHELFHLWIPNSLKLQGDYDWFFEGFTLYHALRTDLRLGFIKFDDYLETIASVYDSYQANAEVDRLSLLEASERRWTTSSLVYEKGMLAGFVYDLMLRRLSHCDASLDDIYADLFKLPATGQANANETIIKLLEERVRPNSFAKDYLESAGRIQLEPALAEYGMQLLPGTRGAASTRLVVRKDLSEPQRRLLRCIGYKN